MRSEDTLLEKWCISLPFYSVTLAIKAEHEAADHRVCHRVPWTKDSEKWLSLYANDPKVYSVTTYSLSENQVC